MHRPRSTRQAVAAFLAAAVTLSAPPASAADSPFAPEPVSWRPAVGQTQIRVTPPDSAPALGGDRDLPVVFLLPDDAWDVRRAWPYLDHLSLLGVTVVELWPEQEDQRIGLPEARAAIASATEELGLNPSRVALLGFGTGGRLALALAGPDLPAVALYPVCHGAAAPNPGARVMVLHPDDPAEARACAALTDGRPGARSARASVGAGHGWDVVSEQSDGRSLLPHPDDPNDSSRRLFAYPDGWATFRAARAVSAFLLRDTAAHLPVGRAP